MTNKYQIKLLHSKKEEKKLTLKEIAVASDYRFSYDAIKKIFNRGFPRDDDDREWLFRLLDITEEEAATAIKENDSYLARTYLDCITISSNSPKPIIYEGIDEVFPGLVQYNHEKDQIFNADFGAYENHCSYYGQEYMEWVEEYRFLTVVDEKTEKIKAIRDFAGGYPTPEDFFLSTHYIPFSTDPIETKESLQIKSKQALTLMKQLKAMAKEEGKREQRKPIILICRMDCNDYVGYSLAENRKIYVYNYKSYRSTFKVSKEEYPLDMNLIANGEEKYCIVVPTQEMLDMFKLDLDYTIIGTRVGWDYEWEPVPPMERLAIKDHKEYQTIVDQAILLINKGYTNPAYAASDLNLLRRSVERLIRLDLLGAPDSIIRDELQLLQKYSDKILRDSQE